jgi:hypothetical protein
MGTGPHAALMCTGAASFVYVPPFAYVRTLATVMRCMVDRRLVAQVCVSSGESLATVYWFEVREYGCVFVFHAASTQDRSCCCA